MPSGFFEFGFPVCFLCLFVFWFVFVCVCLDYSRHTRIIIIITTSSKVSFSIYLSQTIVIKCLKIKISVIKRGNVSSSVNESRFFCKKSQAAVNYARFSNYKHVNNKCNNCFCYFSV